MINNTTQSTFEESKNKDSKSTINTIQRTVLVKRMEVLAGMAQDDIFSYDSDNLYPEKIKAIGSRSHSTKTAIKTLSNFITGEGFEGDDIEINDKGETGFDILRFVSNEKATIGFALHLNYNVFGAITEINKIPFEFVRIKSDQKKAVVRTDWSNCWNEALEYHLFNPKNAIKEIQEVGIENYMGQILYFRGETEDIYPTARFDQVLDDAQFEAEAKIYKLSNIQNDFSLGGVIKYPSVLDSKQEIKDLKKSIQEVKGSANAGKIIAVGFPPTQEMADWKFFEPTSRYYCI